MGNDSPIIILKIQQNLFSNLIKFLDQQNRSFHVYRTIYARFHQWRLFNIRYRVEKLLEKSFHDLEMEKSNYLTWDCLKYQQISFFDKHYHLKLPISNVANEL